MGEGLEDRLGLAGGERLVGQRQGRGGLAGLGRRPGLLAAALAARRELERGDGRRPDHQGADELIIC